MYVQNLHRALNICEHAIPIFLSVNLYKDICNSIYDIALIFDFFSNLYMDSEWI